jgi:hypothetical protein
MRPDLTRAWNGGALSTKRRNAGTPERRNARTLGRRVAGTPERRNAGTPERRVAGSPGPRRPFIFIFIKILYYYPDLVSITYDLKYGYKENFKIILLNIIFPLYLYRKPSCFQIIFKNHVLKVYTFIIMFWSFEAQFPFVASELTSPKNCPSNLEFSVSIL